MKVKINCNNTVRLINNTNKCVRFMNSSKNKLSRMLCSVYGQLAYVAVPQDDTITRFAYKAVRINVNIYCNR